MIGWNEFLQPIYWYLFYASFAESEYNVHIRYENDFGGLGVVCWPIVPKFVGSNPAEAVRFLG